MAESKLFIDSDMTEGESVEVASGSAVVYSARCPGVERPNEDSAAVVPLGKDSGVLIVADGMGGGRAGDKASRLAVDILVKLVSTAVEKGDSLRGAILDGFEKANNAVIELGVGAGTTLAVVEIQKSSIRPYHVGDSVILAIGQRGKVKLQTVPHSPVGYAVESGYLGEKEAIHHEERHLVSNVIGSPEMHIELGPEILLAKNDTVILSSDGLFDNLHTQEIIELSRKGPLGKVVTSLADDCRARMLGKKNGKPSKPDDVTIITFRPQKK